MSILRELAQELEQRKLKLSTPTNPPTVPLYKETHWIESVLPKIHQAIQQYEPLTPAKAELSKRFLALIGVFENQNAKDKLAVFEKRFVEFYPEEIAIPNVSASSEGNIKIDWPTTHGFSLKVHFAQPFPIVEWRVKVAEGKYTFSDFWLNSEEKWETFFEFLKERLEVKKDDVPST